MDKIKKNWIYYLIIFITFYLIPILIKRYRKWYIYSTHCHSSYNTVHFHYLWIKQ